MRLTRRSPLAEVAAHVASALAAAQIRCVLTGGACATIYTRGLYQSSDLDFVLQSHATRSHLDEVMLGIGFERRGDQYFHAETEFFVEFPSGPLAIGSDLSIRPIERIVRKRTLLALSPTDSVRDRLAVFYFWNDRQSLRTAVQIANRERVNMQRIRDWSIQEGHEVEFEEFRRERMLGRRRRRKPR